MTNYVDGRVTTVHKAGTYQLSDDVDQDIERMAEDWDLVDVEIIEYTELSELSLIDRLANTIEISRDGPGDGIEVFLTSPIGGSRTRREISVLLDDDVSEGEEIALETRAVDEEGDLFLPLEESPLVRLSDPSRYRDLDELEERDELDERMSVDLDIPLVERVNGELLRLWRRYRDRTRARVDR